MFTACIYCHGRLPRNRSIEAFPLGQRLAYDGEKGRLWAVCTECNRWNLAPIDERWEALEECERQFRRSALRVSTSNMGLARLLSGIELIRVGAPDLPEFAAWRYGSVLRGRSVRRTRWLIRDMGLLAAASLVGAATGFFSPLIPPLLGISGLWAYTKATRRRLDRAVFARIPQAEGFRSAVVRIGHLKRVQLREDEARGSWSLLLPHDEGETVLNDSEAGLVLGRMVAAWNSATGSSSQVESAISLILRYSSSKGFALEAARRAQSRCLIGLVFDGRERVGRLWLTDVERLALEMSLVEESERRAVRGDLAPLEQAWREAEEIAAIADDLLVPEGVRRFLDARRIDR